MFKFSPECLLEMCKLFDQDRIGGDGVVFSVVDMAGSTHLHHLHHGQHRRGRQQEDHQSQSGL